MTRGKYAKRAELHRDWDALERRAVAAEHRANRLATELDELRDKSDHEIATLRKDLSAVTRQREEAASPKLLEAEERIRSLMKELEQKQQDHEKTKKANSKATTRLTRLIRLLGFSGPEAFEIAIAGGDIRSDLVVADDSTGVSNAKGLGAKAAERIEASKGFRNYSSSDELRTRLIEVFAEAEDADSEEGCSHQSHLLTRKDGLCHE